MELDKRIKEGKRPLTPPAIEEATKYIGKECYLSNSIADYADLNNVTAKRILDYVSNTGIPYSSNPAGIYCYCLPCEWVKQPEKKYRPYTLAEWVDQHEIGEVIHFRDKDYKQKFNVMYTGYVIDNGEDIEDIRTTGRIMLIYTGYFLENLFEDYEICINGEWQPFGVMEDD